MTETRPPSHEVDGYTVVVERVATPSYYAGVVLLPMKDATGNRPVWPWTVQTVGGALMLVMSPPRNQMHVKDLVAKDATMAILLGLEPYA